MTMKINVGNGDFLKLEGTREEIMDFLTKLVGPNGTIQDVINILKGEK